MLRQVRRRGHTPTLRVNPGINVIGHIATWNPPDWTHRETKLFTSFQHLRRGGEWKHKHRSENCRLQTQCEVVNVTVDTTLNDYRQATKQSSPSPPSKRPEWPNTHTMRKYTPQTHFYWKLLFAVPHCLLIASCICGLSGDQCFSICPVVWRKQKGLDLLLIKQSLCTTNSPFIFISTMRCLSLVLKLGSVCKFRQWNNRIRTLYRPNVAKNHLTS